MREKVTSKISSLFNALLYITLALVVVACSHTPITPNSSSYEILTGDAANAISADFIIPPINPLLADDQETEFDYPEQLIWQRIANKAALSKFYKHPRVIQQKQKYLNKTDFLALVSQRSEPFIHFVLSEIEQRQMPVELAILPIVESGYYPKARSRAKAVGLWQFMPHTARQFGLQRNYGYDGRHDVYASTLAALDYLDQLYNTFEGDWLLALAAYNAGPQRIKRALQASTSTEDKISFWELRLPRETREYIPKILALSAIINDHTLSSERLHPINNESLIKPIKLNKHISPSKLIQTAGISAAELRMFNPALRNLNTPTPKDYHLLVPKLKAELVSITIENLPTEILPLWQQHTIARGESLSVIAKRYGTSVTAIQQTNNLSSHTIVAGRTLQVPLFNNSSVSTRPVVSKQKPNKAQDTAPYFYVVATGDSFWKIANRNNTTVNRLAIINGRNPNQPLLPGESILID